ncbi:hypothetical protein B5807_07400 [Epicoccum nigrum]|uniref:Uncharacterized protein n=1 Tax=Epicoccum nigrum TaxID=105696 RepID=A0A1Y2LUX0_EPING|nr:hypothetical protein B5807_07400 [Epicoccum nigrum]
MDNNEVILPFEGSSSKVSASTLPSQPLSYSKLGDDFKPMPISEKHSKGMMTIFYLAVTAPHTDKYEVHGRSSLQSSISPLPALDPYQTNSPAGLQKLENLFEHDDKWGERVDNPAFETDGFHTLLLEGQRRVIIHHELEPVANCYVIIIGRHHAERSFDVQGNTIFVDTRLSDWFHMTVRPPPSAYRRRNTGVLLSTAISW